MCTGKQLQGGSACAGTKQSECYCKSLVNVMRLRCGRTLDSGCSLRIPAYLLVLFYNGFERKSHLVSSSARIVKAHINGSFVGVLQYLKFDVCF